MRDDPNDLIQVSRRYPGKKVKRKIGVYDNELLCVPCESELSAIDDYGKAIFLNRAVSVIDGNETTGCQYEIKKVESEKLKRFLVAVLWRAVVSKRPEFETVKIDNQMKQKAKKIVFEGVVPKHNEFPFLIIKYLPSDIGPVIANPTSFSFERQKWVKLFFPGYCVWMYAGRGVLPDIFRRIECYSGSRLFLYGMSYAKSSTFKAAMNVVAGEDVYK